MVETTWGGGFLNLLTRKFPPEEGVMNVYVTDKGGADTLGQAYVNSNALYVKASSLGDVENPGSLTDYGLSKTLVHEMGHCLSLPHIFDDNACDGNRLFADIPEQVEPNDYTQIVDTEYGWDCAGDNRFIERATMVATGEIQEPKSCLAALLAMGVPLEELTNEMGINYMDYGIDKFSIMFSAEQSRLMRGFLLDDTLVPHPLTIHSPPLNVDPVSETQQDGESTNNVSDHNTPSGDTTALSTDGLDQSVPPVTVQQTTSGSSYDYIFVIIACAVTLLVCFGLYKIIRGRIASRGGEEFEGAPST
jgi:hypothetical protein